MRIVDPNLITEAVREMCIEANMKLSPDMQKRIEEGAAREESPVGQSVFSQLMKNMQIAEEKQIAICQDTGMAICFVKIGTDVHVDGNIEEAITEGIRQGYADGYLRKSIVRQPVVDRVNTGDNTPGVIHYSFVPGDQIEITVAPKGFGSENMSRIYMLKPADGLAGIRDAAIETVKLAGPNACPPMVVGIGVGGNFEKCAELAKLALTRDTDVHSDIPYIRDLEEKLLTEMNKLGIGPAGLGGRVSVLAVNIETYPTHIAGMPVAINICCHVNRHARRVI